ncbi:MAG: UDP-N-acetylmuramoyl-L-alanyl-D-glutamate--2,6-diaminopimelate ligase [Chlamydiales bacterium]|nr:UDP-N-acetylmuramoyl-L-alanyl-D-glutamate--2,6-diaminopimelate ligase [Chlamydiales bacterium]
MKLKVLFKDIPSVLIKGSKDTEITGLCSNSKYVAPGNLFIAKKGASDDGHKHITEAISGGAVAVLTDLYNPFIGKIPQIIHSDVASIEGKLASTYYHDPSLQLLTIGITGTNGKTTCSFLVKHLLDSINMPCGLIGTIEYIVGETSYKASLTTPDVITNHRLLREMLSHNCRAVVMEVSSHALEQKRVDQIHFDCALFTNLTLDHLDYHETMEKYGEAKAKLFSQIGLGAVKKSISFSKVAVINQDSDWAERMYKKCSVPILTYGFSPNSSIRATDIKLGLDKTTFLVRYKDEEKLFSWGLTGRFNILNCLAVTSLGLSLGLSLKQIAEIMSTARPVQGRLEKVPSLQGLNIYVDFAHTDDALENVLSCLNDLKKGRIITVFGCGGNRDRSKRPKMAKVAETYSDVIIVTSDNPRDEEPASIIREIIEGFSNKDCFMIEEDRRKAIEKAIQMAFPDDIVLIAGKGHETHQIVCHKTMEFDDREVAREMIQKRESG